MKTLSTTMAVLLAVAAPLAVNAQSQNPNEIPTNLRGVTTIPAPPAEFNPLTASDQELQDWGFPPRPDQDASPKEYANWARAMAASKTRIIPNLEQTNIFHGPAKLKTPSPSDTETDSAESYNWSGYYSLTSAKSYGSSSIYYVQADAIVPPARQAFGACTGDWDYGSTWVGIDGYNNSDVLQTGFEFDAYCKGGSNTSFYSPWYEWFPLGEVRITNLAIAPGDEYYMEIWHTSSTQGYAYLANFNANAAVEVGFTAPSGTKLLGNSAEWITERPGVNGGLATLTNYIAEPYWDASAESEGKKVYDGGSGSSITMLDNNGKKISYTTKFSSTAFLLQDEGSAR